MDVFVKEESDALKRAIEEEVSGDARACVCVSVCLCVSLSLPLPLPLPLPVSVCVRVNISITVLSTLPVSLPVSPQQRAAKTARECHADSIALLATSTTDAYRARLRDHSQTHESLRSIAALSDTRRNHQDLTAGLESQLAAAKAKAAATKRQYDQVVSTYRELKAALMVKDKAQEEELAELQRARAAVVSGAGSHGASAAHARRRAELQAAVEADVKREYSSMLRRAAASADAELHDAEARLRVEKKAECQRMMADMQRTFYQERMLPHIMGMRESTELLQRKVKALERQRALLVEEVRSLRPKPPPGAAPAAVAAGDGGLDGAVVRSGPPTVGTGLLQLAQSPSVQTRPGSPKNKGNTPRNGVRAGRRPRSRSAASAVRVGGCVFGCFLWLMRLFECDICFTTFLSLA